MSRVSTGDTVRVDYVGRLNDGTVFDSSKGHEPLEFTLGNRMVIPGFEEAVDGLEVGSTVKATIPPERAYGDRDPQLVLAVPRAQFPDEIEPEPGQQLQMSRPGAPPALVTVTEVQDDRVTLDANHPLAGEELEFEITLVEIV